MNVVVHNKLAELSKLDLQELLRLPAISTEDIMSGGKVIKLTVWHDVMKADEHRFVVQAIDNSGALGLAAADGFSLNEGGGKRSLTMDELSEFT